ncbi:MAG: SRPBCC domain-containing protein [Candidatus Sulfotelmatobacter sp.]
MSMSPTIPGIESLSVVITREMHIEASLETTFESLLEQLGPENETPEHKMPMKLEAWPGGRWYRDLGDNNGHLWGHVQAIKRPALLEITGPLFMSYAVANNVQYRLSEEPGGTLLTFHHKAFGIIPDEHRRGMNEGWGQMLSRIQARAEARKK